jgi:hypothetical protein
MIDLIDAIAELIEPWTPAEPTERRGIREVRAQSGTVVDLNAAEPFSWEPNHLYLWDEGDIHALAGVGNPPEEQERFSIAAIYVADSGDEEAQRRRTRTVSAALSQKRHEYAAAIAANRSKYATGGATPWAHLESSLDADLLREFNVRGFALRITGYRFLRG